MANLRPLFFVSNVFLILLGVSSFCAHFALMISWFMKNSYSGLYNVRTYSISDLFLLFSDMFLITVGFVGILLFISPSFMSDSKLKILQYFHCLASIFGVFGVLFTFLITWTHQFALSVLFQEVLYSVSERDVMSFLNPSVNALIFILLGVEYLLCSISSFIVCKDKYPNLF